MATFRISVSGKELLCSFPYDLELSDQLKELDAQFLPATAAASASWVLPIEAEEDVMGLAIRAGYDVEVV